MDQVAVQTADHGYQHGGLIPAATEPSVVTVDELRILFMEALPDGPAPPVPMKSPRRTLHKIKTADLGSRRTTGASHQRLPSYSSVEYSVHADSSSSPRSSTSSRTSQWSEPPPGYPSEQHFADSPTIPAADLAFTANEKAGGTAPTVVIEAADDLILTADEKEELKATYRDDDALSVAPSESVYSVAGPNDDDYDDVAATLDDYAPGTPSEGSKTLWIHARGMRSFRLPTPSDELEIQVRNADGSIAYLSSREKVSSPDALLSRPGVGALVQTTYGKKGTSLACLAPGEFAATKEVSPLPSFTITGKRARRNRAFRYPSGGDGEDGDGREFEWRYASSKTNGKRRERLVLVEKLPSPSSSDPKEESVSESVLQDWAAFTGEQPDEKSEEKDEKRSAIVTKTRALLPRRPTSVMLKRPMSFIGTSRPAGGLVAAARATALPKIPAEPPAPRVLAQLTRTEETWQGYIRGSKQVLRAGTGGELVMEPACGEAGVPEEVVVATALVMLKREQDRLRAVQTAIIATVILGI